MFRRAEFQYPQDVQISYVQRVPSSGESLRGLNGERYVVQDVQDDGAGGIVITCVTPAEFKRERRRARDLLRFLRQHVVPEETESRTTRSTFREDADAVRIAANEIRLREINEGAVEANAAHVWSDPPLPSWTCECGDPTCIAPIHLSVDEYEAVRSSAIHFVIRPDPAHVMPEVERVVQREERYWVVEKIGVGAEMSEELDPRPDPE